jgi:hypothetical protein
MHVLIACQDWSRLRPTVTTRLTDEYQQ